MIKRTALLKEIEFILKCPDATPLEIAELLLSKTEKYLDPKVRPLTDKEVDEHVLVQQVHHSRKDEVRNYVRSLEYEWKRNYLPED